MSESEDSSAAASKPKPRAMVETLYDPSNKERGVVDQTNELRGLVSRHNAELESIVKDLDLSKAKGSPSEEEKAWKKENALLLRSLDENNLTMNGSQKSNIVVKKKRLDKLFGVELASWTENQTKSANLDCETSPEETRVLEQLKTEFFVANGDQIVAWIAFRPTDEQIDWTFFSADDSDYPVVGLVGVSPRCLNNIKNGPKGIVGFWKKLDNDTSELHFAVIKELKFDSVQNPENKKLPERSLKLFESIGSHLRFVESEEIEAEICALPLRLLGVQMQSESDRIVCTFSTEPGLLNPFQQKI
jgi:hypothetical protein